MANLFDKAARVSAKTSKKEKRVVSVDGLEELALIDAALTTLESYRKTLETNVKELVAEEFVRASMDLNGRPENFVGEEGVATASCELRKRSSRSPLSAEEVEMLESFAIPYDTNVSVEGTYRINPKYATNKALLNKLSAALVKSGAPDDLFEYQEQVETKIVSDATMEQVFRKDEETVRTLFSVVGVLALKPKFEGAFENVVKAVTKVLKNQ